MIEGSCCCGAVGFALDAPPRMMGTCHCTRCRKTGASTFVIVDRSTFRWTRGEEEVARLDPGEGYSYARAFCRRCGTSLGDAGSGKDSFAINADALDDDPGVRNRFHEFVSEKPAWSPICDDARQFDRHPG